MKFHFEKFIYINNDIIKNIDSKSLILAPYNSILSESNYCDEDNLALKTEKDIIKFYEK